MSGECCVNPGVKQIHSLKGEEKKINGIPVYQVGNGKCLILIFTDIFGYSFVNVRHLADVFSSSTGTTVIVPDYLRGDPMNPDDPHLWDTLPLWLEKHPPTDAIHIAQHLFTHLQKNYQSIQLIGFCYGAKVVVHFVKDPQLSSMIEGGIVAHPSFLVAEEAKEIRRPMLFLCAEKDSIFSDQMREVFEKELTSKGLGEFHHYPGTEHGFVVRPTDSQQSQEQRDKAVQQAILFFNQHFQK